MFLFQQIGTFNRAKLQDVRNFPVPGPTPDEVRAAGVKVSLIAGELDAAVSAGSVALAQKLLPGSSLQMISGAPHSRYWEAPD